MEDYQDAPFTSAADACQEAQWRFQASTCACQANDDNDEQHFQVDCNQTGLVTNVTIHQVIQNDGWIVSQEFCDETLCVTEQLQIIPTTKEDDYSSNSNNNTAAAAATSRFQSCQAQRNPLYHRHHNARSCHQRPDACWDNATQQWTLAGLVIEHGREDTAVLCFVANDGGAIAPQFVYNNNNNNDHHRDNHNQSGPQDSESVGLLLLRLLGVVILLSMVVLLLRFWTLHASKTRQEEGESTPQPRRRRRRRRDYDNVQQQEDEHDEQEEEDDEEAATPQQQEVELAQSSLFKSRLPVAYAEPLSLESAEFSDVPDESEEWSG